MRYIWKNIWLTLQSEPAISLVLFLGIFLSAFVLNFAVGIYHEFAREALNSVNYIGYLPVTFVQTEEGYVSKQALMDSLASMKKDVTNAMEGFDVNLEVDPDVSIEGFPEAGDVDCIFDIQDGKPTTSEAVEILKGRAWTEKEFENGEKVAYDLYLEAFGNPELDDLSGLDVFCSPYRSSENNQVFLIGGEEYEIIGYMIYGWSPRVPIASVDEMARVVKLDILLRDGAISRYQYEEIRGTLKEDFGNLVQVPELDLEGFDQAYYMMVIGITVLIALISGMILAVSFRFILLQRRKKYGIYQICGCQTGTVRRLFLLESMLVIGGIYLLTVLCYHWLALPLLSGFCIYIYEVANLGYYALIGGILLVCSYFILDIMTRTGIKKEILSNLKGEG